MIDSKYKGQFGKEVEALPEKTLAAISDLKSETVNFEGKAIEVLGYYAKGDGGGGLFYWDAESTEADNGGTIIQATAITTGRWKRAFSGAVNAKWFGAKGDGVTDDTISLQNSLNYLNNGYTYTLPDGIYIVSEINIQSIENGVFNLLGTIKSFNGDRKDVVSILSTVKGCVFNGLKIDGNIQNAFDRNILGDQSNLSLKGGMRDNVFNYLNLTNSIYSGIVFNGNIGNVEFNNSYFGDIGEHCAYISGGSNYDVRFNNVHVKNIGINNVMSDTHECGVFKIRQTSLGANEDFSFNNIIVSQSNAVPNISSVFYIMDAAEDFRIKNIYSPDMPVNILSPEPLIESLYYENITAKRFIYNITGTGVLKDVTLNGAEFDSEGDYNQWINAIDLIENVNFNGGRIVFRNTSSLKNYTHSITFNNCKFTGLTSPLYLDLRLLYSDVNFNDCLVENGIPNTGYTPISVGKEIDSDGFNVTFNNTKIEGLGWNASMFTNGAINLKIHNSEIDYRVRAFTAMNSISFENSKIPFNPFYGSDLSVFGKIHISDCKDLNNNEYFLKKGTTAQRDSLKFINIGFIFKNETTGFIEIYNGTTWEKLDKGSPIQNTDNLYTTEDAMHADQANQLQGYGYLVDGIGAFIYLGTLAGSSADYEPFVDKPKEHEINGIRVTANVSGTYAIDWNAASVFLLTMTADTTFSFSNLPTGVNSKIITVIVTGAFVPIFPAIATLKPATDVYAGAKLNQYTINCINGTASSEMIYYHNELLN